MNKNKLLLGILIVFAVGLYLISNDQFRLFPKQDVVTYLEQRFEQENIPVVKITVLQEDPLQLEFVVQSTSDGEKGTPEDPINFHMVQREAILARREGYFVTNIISIFINKNGEQIGRTEDNNDPEGYTSLDFQRATLGNNSVKELALNKITSLGIAVQDLSVSSMDGFQTLHAVQVVSSLDDARKVGLVTIGSLRSILGDLNKQGAQIVMTHVEIKNSNGDYYLNYLSDLQLTSETWWTHEDLQDILGSGPIAIP